jgi:hypothetical protein
MPPSPFVFPDACGPVPQPSLGLDLQGIPDPSPDPANPAGPGDSLDPLERVRFMRGQALLLCRQLAEGEGGGRAAGLLCELPLLQEALNLALLLASKRKPA